MLCWFFFLALRPVLLSTSGLEFIPAAGLCFTFHSGRGASPFPPKFSSREQLYFTLGMTFQAILVPKFRTITPPPPPNRSSKPCPLSPNGQ